MMRGEQILGTIGFLPLSAALAVFCFWLGNSGQAAGAGPAFTLADMASEAQHRAARSATPADDPEPLETVGAKGGVPGVAVSDQSAPGDSLSNDIAAGDASHEAVAPESYLERLSRIVTGFQDDLQTATQEKLAGRDDGAEQAEPRVAAETGKAAPSLMSLAQEASVPDELVFRLHARSASGVAAGGAQHRQAQPPEVSTPAVSSSESSLTWALVGDAAGAEGQSTADSPARRSETRLSDLVDAGGSQETPRGRSNGQQAVEPAPGGQALRVHATGLTLADMAADMAMVPTPALAKQATAPLAPTTMSLARFALPPAKPYSDAQRMARRSLVFRLPGGGLGQPGPRAGRRQALSFPDPRDLGAGRDDEVLQYPASASLARFLDGVESVPVSAQRRSRAAARGRSRAGRPVMPVSLDQVARRVDWARAASAATGSRSPNRSFSFSSESFAGNHLTTGSHAGQGSGDRRQAVLQELRGVFAPIQ